MLCHAQLQQVALTISQKLQGAAFEPRSCVQQVKLQLQLSAQPARWGAEEGVCSAAKCISQSKNVFEDRIRSWRGKGCSEKLYRHSRLDLQGRGFMGAC